MLTGEPLQIISATEEGGYKADIENLSDILLNPSIVEKNVVVISVAGMFRMGKSFLLNFVLRLLETGDNDELLSDDSELSGFIWRGGSKPATTGIYMWSKPFIYKTKNGDVAVLLLDTEGCFDTESTLKQNATIFALSTLLSSIQVYNLADNILEDALQYLQYFTEYGRLALEGDKHTPFQSLVFLVRDWSYPDEHPYGKEGGDTLLKKRLSMEGLDESSAAYRLRKHIHNCFEEISCILLPHPGMKVATNPQFKGKASDIDVEFRQHLKSFIGSLLSPANLVVKKVAGSDITAGALLQLFKSYDEIFQSDKLPEPKLAFEMTVIARNRYAVERAKDVYRQNMEKDCGEQTPYVAPSEFDAMHSEHMKKSVELFQNSPLMGTKETVEKYEKDLLENIERMRVAFFENNEQKTALSYQTPLFLTLFTYVIYTLAGLSAYVGFDSISFYLYLVMFFVMFVLMAWAHAFWSADVFGLGKKIDVGLQPIIQAILGHLGLGVGKEAEMVARALLVDKKTA